MTTPYLVITKYQPEDLSPEKIGLDLTAITRESGLTPFKNKEIKRNKKAAWKNYDLHAEVRKTAVAGSEAESFHQDGDTSTSNMNFSMVVWANREPTEFKFNGKIYQPQPFEVIVTWNLGCYHRRPLTAAYGERRLFFRQRVENPTNIFKELFE